MVYQQSVLIAVVSLVSVAALSCHVFEHASATAQADLVITGAILIVWTGASPTSPTAKPCPKPFAVWRDLPRRSQGRSLGALRRLLRDQCDRHRKRHLGLPRGGRAQVGLHQHAQRGFWR